MVRAVLIASRHPAHPDRLYAYRNALNRALAGANIEPREPLFVRRPGVSSVLLNPNDSVRMRGASIALGLLIGGDDWHLPGAPLPDGSFALMRADDLRVELVADDVASRTIWYAFTPHELIASTSQRAIVTLLGSFVPNADALPWMLSSGTLGPTHAWDVRLHRVQPGERVVLDRAKWSLRSTRQPIAFAADTSLSRAEHLERLSATVAHACRHSGTDAKKWVLTLSGGADSRSLLSLLRDRRLPTVTWGLRGTVDRPGNDAQVAKALAQALDVPHRFFVIDPLSYDPAVMLDRFLCAGEGRVARISGYLDGFDVWKTLYEEGYDGIVRGDEAFGSLPVASSYAVRYFASLTTLTDHFPPEELERFELPEQPLPDDLERGSDETLATWRDRLYQHFRAPTLLAGLTDLKTAYVEVSTPLLARSVLDCVRSLPDPLRTARRLWRELVAAQVPDIPLATSVALPSLGDYLRNRAVLELLLDELSSDRASSVFAPLLRVRCCAALRAALRAAPSAPPVPRGEPQRRRLLTRAVPQRLREALQHWRPAPRGVDPLVLAFRAFLAIRMHALLATDAATPPVDQRSAITA